MNADLIALDKTGLKSKICTWFRSTYAKEWSCIREEMTKKKGYKKEEENIKNYNPFFLLFFLCGLTF